MSPFFLKAHEVFRDTLFQGRRVTLVRQFLATVYEALLKNKSFCSEKYHESGTSYILCELSSCVFKFVFLDISMTLTQERNGFGFPNNDSLKQSHAMIAVGRSGAKMDVSF